MGCVITKMGIENDTHVGRGRLGRLKSLGNLTTGSLNSQPHPNKNIVIPSESNERGNLLPPLAQGDCHSRYAPSQ